MDSIKVVDKYLVSPDEQKPIQYLQKITTFFAGGVLHSEIS